MGFFSDLFGGGDVKVTQTAQQNTTVNTQVEVANHISTEEIAKVLEKFGIDVTKLTGETKALVQVLGQQLAEQSAIELISQLQFNDLIRKRTKQAAMIGIAIFAIWFFSKKGRKK